MAGRLSGGGAARVHGSTMIDAGVLTATAGETRVVPHSESLGRHRRIVECVRNPRPRARTRRTGDAARSRPDTPDTVAKDYAEVATSCWLGVPWAWNTRSASGANASPMAVHRMTWAPTE